MPSNTFITNQIITKECAMYLSNLRKFSRNVNHQFDGRFGQQGAQIGARLEIRLPNRFTSRTGNKMKVQTIQDQSTALIMSTIVGIDLNISTVDFTLSIEEFRERYIKPQMSQLSTDIDLLGLQAALGLYQTVGTYGTTPSDDQPILAGAAALDNIGVPRDGNRHGLMNPMANAKIVHGLSTLFNPANAISEHYRKGIVVDAWDLVMNMTQNIPVLTCGDRAGTIIVAADAAQGDTQISVSGMSGTLNAGEIIELGGTGYPINLVNYETRKPIPNARLGTYNTAQFVVTESVTSPGIGSTVTVKISPALIGPISGVQTAYQTVDRLPVASMQVTPLGTASTPYPVNLVYHKDAFALAFADLFLAPGGPEICHREKWEDISVRVWKQGDIINNTVYHRVDVMCAWALVQPELGCRITG